MELGEIIKQYRVEHGLSQRQFSKMCGVSNTYISFLENGRNSDPEKKVAPSLTVIRDIAQGMGMNIQDLIAMADDFDVDISAEKNQPTVTDGLSEAKKELIAMVPSMSESLAKALLELAKEALQR
jgi:transcriptional regulator with XRE-family HTH domain